MFLAPAGEAGIRMLRQNQFKDVASQLLKLRCICINYHALGCWSGAGGRESPHILDLDDTRATATVWRQTGVVTQSGNVNACLSGHFQYRGSFSCLDLLPVNGQVEGTGLLLNNHAGFLSILARVHDYSPQDDVPTWRFSLLGW